MVTKDYDGWVDADRFLPADYDLVLIKGIFKLIVAWHAGHKWDGLQYVPGTTVKYWKKKRDL